MIDRKELSLEYGRIIAHSSTGKEGIFNEFASVLSDGMRGLYIQVVSFMLFAAVPAQISAGIKCCRIQFGERAQFLVLFVLLCSTTPELLPQVLGHGVNFISSEYRCCE